MGRITSNVGLITGIPITDTVDQLMAVAGKPRDLLASRNQGLQQQQLAVNSLSSRILALKFDLGKLGVSDPYQARSVTSLNEDVLSATLKSGGKPPLGTFKIQPVQTASSQQLISQRFESLDDIQSSGTFGFGYGGFLDKGISLDDLNEGAGVSRGEIKITDSDGDSAVIDLTLATSVDDVLDAINQNNDISVTASVSGDNFVLTDIAGGAGTLEVEEASGGSTAADLGLLDVTPVSSVITGDDVFTLHSDTRLTDLNDGNGVWITDDEVDDLTFTLTDDSTATVDLSGATTLEDVVDAINNDEDLSGNVTAVISSDGNRLEITDSTSGSGTFTIANGATGSAADDLGLTTTEDSGVITGDRLVSGLRGTLLASLNGGAGVGALGSIDITDRNGSGPDTVDLTGAETVQDVVDAINGSSADVLASFNDARNGIVVTDTSGGTGDLIIEDDVNNSATALGIVVSDSVASIASGVLGRQILSEATLLSSLNGGQGITASDIKITDSDGVTASIDLNKSGSEAETIGDVIDAINDAGIGVEASINVTGDGILITDTVLGSQTLGIKDVNGTLAADLNLTRASEVEEINGQDTQVIDGTNSYSVDLSDIDGSSDSISLSSLNDGAGITLSDIRITDSNGKVMALDLNGVHAGITTVGELIDAINDDAASQGVAVTASVNSSETGIMITDTGEGSKDLLIEDINGTAAADLKILSKDTTTTSVDGIGLFSSQSASQGALKSIADRINELESGVTATSFFDGIGYRLSLVVDKTGAENEILIDASDAGFKFTEISKARDALVVLGEQQTVGAGILIRSASNDFDEIITGVELSVVGTSDVPIDVVVDKTSEDLIANVEDFVASYNTIRSDLDSFTEFDEEALTTGLLFGTNEALRVDTTLSRLITDRYSGVGSFESLEAIGLSVDDKGKLSLDKAKLGEAFESDAQSLQTLFSDEERGIVAKFDQAVDSLAGSEFGLLTNRSDALQSTIDSNTARIDSFNESLDRQRERMLLEFYQLEQVIAGLQQSQSALASFQPIAPLVSGR